MILLPPQLPMPEVDLDLELPPVDLPSTSIPPAAAPYTTAPDPSAPSWTHFFFSEDFLDVGSLQEFMASYAKSSYESGNTAAGVLSDIVGGISGGSDTGGQFASSVGWTLGLLGLTAAAAVSAPVVATGASTVALAGWGLSALKLIGITQTALQAYSHARAGDMHSLLLIGLSKGLNPSCRLLKHSPAFQHLQQVPGESFILNTFKARVFEVVETSIDTIWDVAQSATDYFTRQSAQATGIPQVGGILFENCDARLTNIGEVEGAYWDGERRELVLVGTDESSGRQFSSAMPAMDEDHLVVALRAALAGLPLGVSIDPPAHYRGGASREVDLADGTPMLVSYLGDTDHTLFGAVMFEADRLLKCLDKNIDNLTGRPLEVPDGHRSLFDWNEKLGRSSSRSWHRFWFVIDEVVVDRSRDGDSLVFSKAKIRLCTETEIAGRKAGASPADAAFCDQVTRDFDRYAVRFPILARLTELAKVAAIAKHVVNSGVPLEVDGLLDKVPQYVATPDSTPGITASRSYARGNRSTIVSYFGGVDLDAPLRTVTNDARAIQLRFQAETSRPERAVSWGFDSGGRRLRATAVSLRRNRDRRTLREDHACLPIAPFDLLKLERVAEPGISSAEFGLGWRLWMPYELELLHGGAKRADVQTGSEPGHGRVALIFRDHLTGVPSKLYAQTSGSLERGRAVFSRMNAIGRTGYALDGSDRVVYQSGRFLLRLWDRQCEFDARGRLERVVAKGQELLRVERDQERVVRLSDGRGLRYELESKSSGRVDRVRCFDDRDHYAQIDYRYERGQLSGVQCSARESRQEEYHYSRPAHLASVRDGAGRVQFRVLPSREEFRSAAVDGSTRTLVDSCGARFTVEDLPSGETSLAVFDRSGRELGMYQYDARGRLSHAMVGSGRPVEFEYDSEGRVVELQGPSGTLELERDSTGRILGAIDPSGNDWRVEYDRKGRPIGLSGDVAWTLRNRRRKLELSGPGCSVTTQQGHDGFKVRSKDGLSDTELLVQKSRWAVRRRTRDGGETQSETRPGSYKQVDRAGTTQWRALSTGDAVAFDWDWS